MEEKIIFVDEDGNDVMVYHARKEAEIEGDPLYNPNRHAMLMKVRWDENGRPVFSYKDWGGGTWQNLLLTKTKN